MPHSASSRCERNPRRRLDSRSAGEGDRTAEDDPKARPVRQQELVWEGEDCGVAPAAASGGSGGDLREKAGRGRKEGIKGPAFCGSSWEVQDGI